MCRLFLRVKWRTFVAGFWEVFDGEWQVVAVVEIANLQRPRKKITVEYLACSWRTFWAAGYAVLLFGKHVVRGK